MPIGLRIKQLLKNRGISQVSAAKELGITSSLLSAYITGKAEPRHATIAALTKLLDTSADFLVGNSEHAASYKFEVKSEFAYAPIYSSKDSVREGYFRFKVTNKIVTKMPYIVHVCDCEMEPVIKRGSYCVVMPKDYILGISAIECGALYAVRFSKEQNIAANIRYCSCNGTTLMMYTPGSTNVLMHDIASLDFNPIYGKIIVCYTSLDENLLEFY